MARSDDCISRPPIAWRLWLAVGAGATLTGLGLSGLGQLNARGYTVVGALGALLAGWFWWAEFNLGLRRLWCRRRRFRRGAPAGFLCLAVVAGLGGALYPPVNWDTLWYRLPRVLHWLAEGRWHWIHSHEPRFNFIAPGIEWLWTPLVAWSGSDRFIFLPNLLAFFLLPGLVFSSFTRLGIRARVAWWWMWLVPAGWVFALQAGSAANDAYAATYALLMVDLALRSRAGGDLGRRTAEGCWALLAVALLTNTKQSNAPLGLLWLLAAAPAWRLASRRPVATLTVALIAALVSMIPSTWMNWHYTGEWMGVPKAQQIWVPTEPLSALVANAFLLPLSNLVPPLVPGVARWNDAMAKWVEGPWGKHLHGFEFFGQLPTSVTEAWAGLGLTVTLLTLMAWYTARWCTAPTAAPTSAYPTRWVRWSIWPVLALFMAKLGVRQSARYFAAYYPFVLVSLLVGGNQLAVIRRRWWRPAALIVLWSSVILVAVSRQRPILPTPGMCLWIAQHVPGASGLARLRDRQLEYLSLNQRLAPFYADLANEKVIGYAAYSVGEVRLWEPFGSRVVRHITAQDTLAEMQARGIRRLIVNDIAAVVAGDADGLAWAARRGGRIVRAFPLSLAEATARRGRGEKLELDALALQKVPAGAEIPVDNLYLVELPEK